MREDRVRGRLACGAGKLDEDSALRAVKSSRLRLLPPFAPLIELPLLPAEDESAGAAPKYAAHRSQRPPTCRRDRRRGTFVMAERALGAEVALALQKPVARHLLEGAIVSCASEG